MISRPPMISPQRILLSSMKALSTSVNDRRGARGGGVALTGSVYAICSVTCGPLGSCCGGKNEGVGSITISSSVAVRVALTIEGGDVGSGVAGVVSGTSAAGTGCGNDPLGTNCGCERLVGAGLTPELSPIVSASI